MFVLSNLLVSCVLGCPHITYHEHLYLRANGDSICPRVKLSFSVFRQWHLGSLQVLQERFPINPVLQNYVREVKNALFSAVKPTPLRSKRRLAAVSTDALAEILDLDADVIQWDEDFVQAG